MNLKSPSKYFAKNERYPYSLFSCALRYNILQFEVCKKIKCKPLHLRLPYSLPLHSHNS